MMLAFCLLIHLTNAIVLGAIYGDLRLVGTNPARGRLEVYLNEWGTVCDDSFDDIDAKVACRQLGYRAGESLGSSVASGTGSILMDDLKCNGKESKLTACDHTKTHNCNHNEDVGIACFGLNGGWSSWTSWSSCSNTCGYGKQYKHRKCNNPVPDLGGGYCSGSPFLTTTCRSAECPVVNGGWSSWYSWSSCSVTCGAGTQQRYRRCNNPTPNNGGSACSGSPISTKNCYFPGCGTWNGAWSDWFEWSECSATCGNGTRHRYRRCNNPPPNSGGSFCNGATLMTQVCRLVNCSEQSLEQSLSTSTKVSVGVPIGIAVGCFIAIIALLVLLCKQRSSTKGTTENIKSENNYETLHKNNNTQELQGIANTEFTESQADEQSVTENSKTEEKEEQYENLEIK